MKTKILVPLILLFTWCTLHTQDEKQKQIIDDSKEAKKPFLAKDKDMNNFFNKSYGYVIFPNMARAA